MHGPIEQFGDVNLILRRARDFVNPPELFDLLARLAEHAENLGRPVPPVRVIRRNQAIRGLRAGRKRHVDFDLAREYAIGSEHLNADIPAVRYLNVTLRIGSDAVWRTELSRLAARLAPGFHPVAVLVELGHAGVHVAVADVDIALRVPCDYLWVAGTSRSGEEGAGSPASMARCPRPMPLFCGQTPSRPGLPD